MLVPALLAAVLALIAAPREGRAFWATTLAVVLFVAVFVVSVVVSVPINHDQTASDAQTPPPDWSAVRDRWQIAHAVRTAAGCWRSDRCPSRDTQAPTIHDRPMTPSVGHVNR
jgi:uncharacterized membrane protein